MGRRIFVAFAVLCALTGGALGQEQGRSAIFPQLGHSGIVQSLAFSPDSKTLASGGLDHTIKLWDMASGRLLRTLTGHTGQISALAFSLDGTLLASTSWDATVRIWDLRSGGIVHVLKGHSGIVSGVAFSPDAKLLVSCGLDGVAFWDVASGTLQRANTMVSCNSMALSPDGKFVVAKTMGNVSAQLLDVASAQVLRTFSEAKASGSFVAYSPDGSQLALSDNGAKSLTLWNVASAHEQRTLIADGNGNLPIAFSPDWKTLVTGDAHKATVDIWDGTSGGLQQTLPTQRALAGASSVAFSPDGKLLAVGGVNDIAVLETKDWTNRFLLSTKAFTASSVAFVPHQNALASVSGASVKLWGATDAGSVVKFGAAGFMISGLYSLAFSSDGKLLAAGAADSTIKLWDVVHSRELPSVGKQWGDSALSVAFSPDGKVLAAGGATIGSSQIGGAVHLLDVTSGRELRVLSGQKYKVNSVAFSPNGKLLAAGSDDGTIKLWDAANGHEICTMDGNVRSLQVHAIAFSPDGKLLASGNADSTAKLWDVASCKVSHTLSGFVNVVAYTSIVSVAFSPNGKLLAAGTADNSIQLWDLASGTIVRTFVGHRGPVLSVAFSGDGKTLASGSLDGTTREWDVATGKERAARIVFGDGSVNSVVPQDFITVTPEGFFDSSSEQAEENLNVRISDRVFGISSFRTNFYRPDLVQRALAGADISQFGSIDTVKLSPVVEFASMPATTTDSNLKLTLKLTNGGGGFGPVRIFWDGTVIEQDGDLPPSADTLTRSYAVPLSIGDNEVRTTVANADFSMASDMRADVTVNLPPVAKAANAHGTLHAIVIGVQEFPKAPGNNLSYPNADAKLMADTLNAAAAPLFERLDIPTPLTGAANTDKAHIVQALEDMRATAKPEDEFVFYVAGHGTVAAGQYYLMTSDSASPDPSSLKASAISASELSDLIANIHVAKKLVILDTCDSGAAGTTFTQANAGLDVKTAATILARDYGFTVLAAAESNQEAQESGYQKHGLFSFVIADGLAGKAADAGSGIVSSFLLANYVKSQVPIIAQTVLHHAQQPTSETSGNTFDITKVK